MRWSSTSTQMRSTTDPRALCGEGMKWGWAWGSPPALCWGEVWKAGKELWAPGVSRQPCEKIRWRGAISQKKTGRAVGEGSQGEARMADVQLSRCQRSCLSRRLITPCSRAGSSRWKSKTTVLRSNKKGLNNPVFLVSPFSSSFYFWKTLCFSILWYPLYTKIPDVPHPRGKDFQRLTGNMLPPFHNLEIRGTVSKSNRNVFWQARQATVLFHKALVGFHPGLKSTKTLLVHFVLCSCSNEAE